MVALTLMLTGALAGCGRPSRDGRAEAAQPSPQNDPGDRHIVTVLFDYDFQKNPSCAERPSVKACVKQFDVYDVSGGRVRLFSIPVPKNAIGFVRGITGQSPSRIFLPGTHFIAVTAENSAGAESNVITTRVEVKAKTGENLSGGVK
jgi:hypothetical protein